jgi:hypothetical protein
MGATANNFLFVAAAFAAVFMTDGLAPAAMFAQLEKAGKTVKPKVLA